MCIFSRVLIVCYILLLFSFALQLAGDNDEKYGNTTYIAISVADYILDFVRCVWKTKRNTIIVEIWV